MHSEIEKTKSAGGVVISPSGQILVVSQKGMSWSLPKGGIENGEDELTAAKREIYEESGISELELVRALGSYERFAMFGRDGENKKRLKKITLFLFKTNQVVLRPVDKDNPEAVWLNIDEVESRLTHPADANYFRGLKNSLKSLVK